MNTRTPISEPSTPISLFAAFNQDASRFAVGLNSGFCIFNTKSSELEISRPLNGGIGQIQMLGQSKYVALVGGGINPRYKQNVLNIWDEKQQRVVLTVELRTSILGTRLSNHKIVAALQNSIHVYEFVNPPKKQYVFETADNLTGLCCLGSKIVAFPGKTPGNIQLVELETGNISIIPAHTSPLRALELSPNGELLVTASEKGTLIRIFSTSNSTRVAELRRGIDAAIIFSMRISPNNRMLAITSDKSTLHVFDIPSPDNAAIKASEDDTSAQNKWSFLSKVPFLPRAFSDTYSFASANFNLDDDPDASVDSDTAKPPKPIPGVPGGRAAKGILAWLDDDTMVVIGAGRDGKWQKFILRVDKDGNRVCEHAEWRRYLGGDSIDGDW